MNAVRTAVTGQPKGPGFFEFLLAVGQAEVVRGWSEKGDKREIPLWLIIPLSCPGLSGRIMAVADVYDALICKRVYKPPFPHEKAVSIISEGRGSHFDPDVVDAFLEVEEFTKRIAAELADSEQKA